MYDLRSADGKADAACTVAASCSPVSQAHWKTSDGDDIILVDDLETVIRPLSFHLFSMFLNTLFKFFLSEEEDKFCLNSGTMLQNVF